MRVPAWITVREDGRQDESRDGGPFRGVVAVERAPRLEIERRWVLPNGGAHACAIGTVMLLLVSIAVARGSLVWGGLFAGGTVTCAYVTLAMFVNRTRITVDDDVLGVAHGPLPWLWMADRDVPIDKIARVFARPVRFTSKDEHEVVVELKRRGETQLLRGIANAEQATFIALTTDTSVHAHDLRAAGASLR